MLADHAAVVDPHTCDSAKAQKISAEIQPEDRAENKARAEVDCQDASAHGVRQIVPLVDDGCS